MEIFIPWILLVVFIILFVYVIEHEYRLISYKRMVEIGTSILYFFKEDNKKMFFIAILPFYYFFNFLLPHLKYFFYNIEYNYGLLYEKVAIFILLVIIINLSIKYVVSQLYYKWGIRNFMYYSYYIFYNLIVLMIIILITSKYNIISKHNLINFVTLLIEIITIAFLLYNFFHRFRKNKIHVNSLGFQYFLLSFFIVYFVLFFAIARLFSFNDKVAGNLFLLLSLTFAFLIISKINVSFASESLKKDMITFLNLDILDIVKSDFYSNCYSVTDSYNGRFFKIDLSQFFEKDAKDNIEDKKVQIINHRRIHIVDSPGNEHAYVYFYVDDLQKSKSILIKFQLIYMKNGKVQKERLDICVRFDRYGNEILVGKIKVLNYYKIYWEKKCIIKIFEKTTDIWKYMDKLYQYDENFLDIEINYKPDGRKWMVHKGEFGSGKTSLDVVTLSDKGFIPVVISPWEENTDEDLLYLVYHHLSKQSGIKMMFPNQSVIFFFLASLCSVSFLLTKILKYTLDALDSLHLFEWLKNLVVILKGQNLESMQTLINTIEGNYDVLYDIAIWGIALFFAFVFTCMLLPTIVIHVKNSSKVHQSYYLDGIYKMLKKTNAILVIEDIDRYSLEKIEMIYRLISSINTACGNLNRCIGLISYQFDHIYMNECLRNSIDKDKINDYLATLENKVVCLEYLKEYRDQSSKQLYFKQCIYGLILGKDIKEFNLEKDEKSIKKKIEEKMYPKIFEILKEDFFLVDNFRKLRDHLGEIVKIFDKNAVREEIDPLVSKYIKENII